MTKPLYMGIDGGGSTLRIGVYTADMQPVHVVRHPHSANPSGIGREVAAKRLQDGVRETIFGLSPGDASRLVAVGAGIAGADSRYAGDWVRETLGAVLPKVAIFPSADYDVALVGANGQRFGVLLLAGTGSSSFGVNTNGETVVVGGWGYRAGDEGSGYWIAWRGMQRLAQAIDGRVAHSLLTTRLTEELALQNPRDDLLEWLYHKAQHQDIATYAQTVLTAANDGDKNAVAIVDEAANLLYDHYAAIVRQLRLESPPIAFAGGLLTEDTLLAHRLALRLGLEAPPKPKYPPVAGAALYARIMSED